MTTKPSHEVSKGRFETTEHNDRAKFLNYFESWSGIDFVKISQLHKSILIVLFLISILSFFISMHDIYHYGGVDLRNKVVGSRAFWHGINPYSVELTPPTSDWLLDPARRHPGPSRATVTPFVLVFYGLLAWLPYKIQRIGWALLEWAAMLASILILNKTIKSPKSRFLFLTLSLLFFVSGYFWRLHVERGQYYIFLTLILSIGIYFDLVHKGSKFAGIPFGLSAMFRPTYFLLFFLLFIFKKFKTVLVMLITAILCFIVTFSICGVAPWITYADNVKKIEAVVIDKNVLNRQYGPIKEASEIAEGVHIMSVMGHKTCNETFIGALITLKDNFRITYPYDWSFTNNLLSILAILSSIVFGYFFEKQKFGSRFVLLFSLVMIINLDLFVPERYSYVDVLFLPILALIIPYVTFSFFSSFPFVIILFSFACNQFIGALDGASGTLIRYLLFVGFLNYLFLYLMIRRISIKKKKPLTVGFVQSDGNQ